MTDDLSLLVRSANPVPTIDRLSDEEFSSALAAIEGSVEQQSKRRPGSSFFHRTRQNPAIVFAAATVMVVLVVAIPLLLFATREGEVSEPTVTSTVAPTTTAAPPTTTAPATTTAAPTTTTVVEVVVPPAPEITWTRVPGQPAFENATIGVFSSLVEGGPGLVGVGDFVDGSPFLNWRSSWEAVGNQKGVVFVSADGVAWERIDLPWDTMHVQSAAVNGLARGPGGTLVAGGNDGSDAAIWVSADGMSWTRVSSDALGGPEFQNILRVKPGGPGFVAVGDDGPNAGVWVSTDGYEWTKVEDDDLLAGDENSVTIYDVTAGGPGLVAVGSAGLSNLDPSIGSGVTGAAWISRTGYEWERLPQDTFAAESATLGGLGSITAHPATGRLIAWGSERGMSPDGYHWVVTERDMPFGGPPGASDVAWNGNAAVAAGFDAALSLWVSGDAGANWTRVEPVEPAFDDYTDQAHSVTWFDGRWIVAGEDSEGGVIWIGTPEE